MVRPNEGLYLFSMHKLSRIWPSVGRFVVCALLCIVHIGACPIIACERNTL